MTPHVVRVLFVGSISFYTPPPRSTGTPLFCIYTYVKDLTRFNLFK